MDQPGRLFGFTPQFLVQDHIQAAPGPAIEKRPGRNRLAQHLFQANGLGAELDLVGMVRFRLPPLVLHGERPPRSARLPVILDDIGFADQPQSE